MGPTSVLSAPDRPHVGPMNLAIKVVKITAHLVWRCNEPCQDCNGIDPLLSQYSGMILKRISLLIEYQHELDNVCPRFIRNCKILNYSKYCLRSMYHFREAAIFLKVSRVKHRKLATHMISKWLGYCWTVVCQRIIHVWVASSVHHTLKQCNEYLDVLQSVI